MSSNYSSVCGYVMWDSLLYAVSALLPLVNKEAAFGQWLKRVESGGRFRQICRERVGRVTEMPCSLCRRQMPVLVNHESHGKI